MSIFLREILQSARSGVDELQDYFRQKPRKEPVRIPFEMEQRGQQVMERKQHQQAEERRRAVQAIQRRADEETGYVQRFQERGVEGISGRPKPAPAAPTPSLTPPLTPEEPTREKNLPQRNNNPGNIKIGGVGDEFAEKDENGEPKTDDQGHLVFGDEESGWKAFRADVKLKQEGKSKHVKKGATLAEMGKTYAEDPKWAQNVALIAGVDVNTPIDQIPLDVLTEAIATQEGWYAR